MEQDPNPQPDANRTRAVFSRRRLLEGAGWAAAFAALPGDWTRRAWAVDLPAGAVSPPMARLSAYMSEARDRALPDGVVEQGKLHILDTFAAMVSGSELAPGQAAMKFARNYGGERVATVVASDLLIGPLEAALVNGLLAHSDETDDAHAASLSHPGAPIVPAALAAGETFGTNGAQFLRGVVLGYDIGTRFEIAMGGPAVQTEEHRSAHSIAGIFGAAAAAASAANLNPQQMRWVIDYTAQQSSGVAAWQRDTQHIEKGFVYAGMPARGGLTSAMVVQSGWTGVDDILSGSDNFFMAYAPQGNPEELVDQLGERYEITQTEIKKWTVGAPIQAVLDALEKLLQRQPIDPDKVRQIVVRVATHQASVVNNREMPDICLQHMVAIMLIDKTATFQSAHDKARMRDPAVLALRAKVQLIGDDELQRLLPMREAIVEITFADGKKLSERITAVRGTPANPMPRNEVVAKTRDLMAPVLGSSKAAALTQQILGLEHVQRIVELRSNLQKS